jgi:hypothetical protein
MNARLWFGDTSVREAPTMALLHRRHLRARLDHLTQETHVTRMQRVWATLIVVGVLGTAATIAAQAIPVTTPGTDAGQPASLRASLRPPAWAGVIGRLVVRPRPQAQEPAAIGDTGVTPPRVVSETKPVYTQAAMDAKIAGDVLMTAIVTVDGGVRDIAVTQSLDATYGLDQAVQEQVVQRL